MHADGADGRQLKSQQQSNSEELQQKKMLELKTETADWNDLGDLWLMGGKDQAQEYVDEKMTKGYRLIRPHINLGVYKEASGLANILEETDKEKKQVVSALKAYQSNNYNNVQLQQEEAVGYGDNTYNELDD